MGKDKGGNMTTVKWRNRSLILKLLKDYGALSRVDIAKKLQLTPAAITILVNEMMKEGIIKEVGQLEESDIRAGRKKVLIDINYEYKYVIGINIDSQRVNIGICDIKGKIIAYRKLDTRNNLTPKEFLNNIASECMGILWKANILKENILGVGVGIIGYVDRERGISKHAFGLWHEEVNVKKILEEALELKVVVDNNVRTLALGEMSYYTKEKMSNIVYIKYGPGIGSAVIINNELYYGNSGISGEIGHTIIDYNGQRCRCGRRGCLETVASEGAIKDKVLQSFSEDKTPVLYKICEGALDNINLLSVIKSAEKGDKEIIKIMKEVIFYLGTSIANMVTLYDPDKVILYGNAFNHQFFMKEVKKILEDILGYKALEDFISLSKLNNKTNYIGGSSLALKKFFYDVGGIS